MVSRNILFTTFSSSFEITPVSSTKQGQAHLLQQKLNNVKIALAMFHRLLTLGSWFSAG